MDDQLWPDETRAALERAVAPWVNYDGLESETATAVVTAVLAALDGHAVLRVEHDRRCDESTAQHPPLPTDVTVLLRQLARYFGRMEGTPPKFVADYLNMAAQRYQDEGLTTITSEEAGQ